jgi:hypothetical protein
VSTDPGHDTKCWSHGTSVPSLFLTKCNFCKSIRAKNADGTFSYRVQYDSYNCVDSFTNPEGDVRLNNCEIGYGSKSKSCDYCDDNFSLNLNFGSHTDYSTNCVPDAECTNTSEQVYFEEVTYANLIPPQTKKYCTSCPTNCLTCDENNDCVTCTSTTYANFNAADKRCNCIVPNCRNCTNSECDICDSGRRKHIDDLNVVTCPQGLNSNQGCIEGYGRILGEVVPPLYSPTCRPC